MADTPSFAGIALRTSPSHWDAGLHGESEGAEVQVGLAIDGAVGAAQRVGLWVETERLGRLALSLDVPPTGAAQIAAISHARETKGPLVPGVAPGAVDQKKLEEELTAARAQLRTDAAKYEEAIAALKKELDEARADLSRGQEERRRGQAELDAIRSELAAKGEGSAEMVRNIEEAQAAHEATKKDLEDTRSQVKELRSQLAKKGEAQEAVEKRCHQLEAEAKKSAERIAELEKATTDSEPRLKEVEARLAERSARFAELQTELEEAKKAAAKVATLEKKAAEGDDTRSQLTKERAKLKERTSELSQARIDLEKLKQEAGAVVSLTGEVERLKVDLEAARAEAAAHSHAPDAEVALQAEMEKSSRLLQERDEAREIARELKRAATQAVAERDEARAVARSLHQRTSGGGTHEVASLRTQLQVMSEDKQLLETRLLQAQKQIELERKRAQRLAGGGQELVTDEVRVADFDPSRQATATHEAYVPPNPSAPKGGKKP